MKELLSFILEEITGGNNFSIEESEVEAGKIVLEVKADPAVMGLIIGKGGNTIKAITTVLRVKGRIEQKFVNINVSELS